MALLRDIGVWPVTDTHFIPVWGSTVKYHYILSSVSTRVGCSRTWRWWDLERAVVVLVATDREDELYTIAVVVPNLKRFSQ